MRHGLNLMFLFSFFLFLPFAAAQDNNERTSQGYQVAKDNYLAIPSDMQVKRIGSNVITPEPDIDYLARKLEEQNKQIEEMRLKMEEMDARLKKLEGHT